MSNFSFVDCIFNNCNLSNVTVINSTFRDAEFNECKMLGVDFNRCHEYGLSASFVDCQLSHSIFFKRILKKTVFRNCQIVEADFTECDLSEAVFDDCDLSGSTFDRTKLLKTDLRTARNYTIDPEKNLLKGARLSLSGLPGLLGKYGLQVD